MNWRYVYKDENNIHYHINDELREGYEKLKYATDVCCKLYNIVENTVVLDDETVTETNYGSKITYDNTELFNLYVKKGISDYEYNMQIQNYIPMIFEFSKYHLSSNLLIDSNSSGLLNVSDAVKNYLNTSVSHDFDGTATSGGGIEDKGSTNISLDYDNAMYLITNSISKTMTEESDYISKFATHFQVFINNKIYNSQYTDIYDSICTVYSSKGFTKFSKGDYNNCINILSIDEYVNDYESYMKDYTSISLSNDDKNLLYSYFNSDNRRGYMCSLEQITCQCKTYFGLVQENLTNKKNIVELIEDIELQIDLQIQSHETEATVLDSLISELSSMNISSDTNIVDMLDKLNDIYTLNDVSLNSNQLNILDIDEQEYLEANPGVYDEVFQEIVNQYLDGDLKDEEFLNLAVEYPYLNVYIEQYLIDNVSLISDNSDKNKAKMYANLQILNSSAKSLIENGITSIENIKVVGENKINFDGIYFGDAYGTEIKSCSIYYGQVLEGEDGGYYTISDELQEVYEDNKDEIDELKEKYSSISSFGLQALYGYGIGEIEGKLTEKAFEAIKNSFSVGGPVAAAVANITYDEFKEYYETMVRIDELTEENASILNAFIISDELGESGQLPFGYTYTVVGKQIIDNNYIATPDSYQVVNNAYDLEAANNPDTSQEDRDELQDGLIQQAHNGYGDHNFDDKINDDDKLESGVNGSVYGTYSVANSVGGQTNVLDKFSTTQYINDDGVLDMNAFMLDYLNPNNNYEDMFSQIDHDITQNSGKDSDSDE